LRYRMKEQFLALGDDFSIQDEHGRDVFFVDGHAFSFGNKLSFQDMDRNELAFIAQKLLAWGPTYEITRDGQLVAVIKKELFTFFNARFTVDVPGPDDLLAEGSLFDREYTFTRHGQPVAQVSKKRMTMSDTYAIDIAEGEDDVLILCSAVVIDLVCHEPKK
jgi:uncharacterized protein YxjI